MYQIKNQLKQTVASRMNSQDLKQSVLLQMLLRITKESKLQEVAATTSARIHVLETTAKISTMAAKTSTTTSKMAVADTVPAATVTVTNATTDVQKDHQRDTAVTATMTSMSAHATREVPGEMSVTAFQLIRPSRISNSVMSSAMTRLSKTDTARLKITESLSTVVLVPILSKDVIP
jgi:uncharacterized membrane protein YkoI